MICRAPRQRRIGWLGPSASGDPGGILGIALPPAVHPIMASPSHESSPLKLTIVTPSFNQQAFIDATIQSVMSQDYPHIQYIVMDGGSTDGTVELLKQHGEKFRWISQVDKGQTDAIARGFAMGDGEILTWVNSDDTLEPGAVSRAMQYLADHPEVDLVYGDAAFIDQQGRFIAECAHVEPFDRHRLLHYSDFIVQPAAFFRRSALEQAGGLDITLHWAMDYDLWLKLTKNGKAVYLPGRLANYRWLGDNKTASGGSGRLVEVLAVAQRHGASGLPAYFKLEAVLHHYTQSRQALRDGQFSRAMAELGRALGAWIFSPRAWWSLMQKRTWRIIRTGQIIRAAAKCAAAMGD